MSEIRFAVPSRPGSEREVGARVARLAVAAGASPELAAGLELAVCEVARNAAEHGNRDRCDLPVAVTARVGDGVLTVRITDQGVGGLPSEPRSGRPEALLAGAGEPRGLGLELVHALVDRVRAGSGPHGHTVELVASVGSETGS